MVALCVCMNVISIYIGQFGFPISLLHLETDRPFLRLLFILMRNLAADWLLAAQVIFKGIVCSPDMRSNLSTCPAT